jgi:anaerobic dimethyl sulfoxide reductase subunit C (anchor subunit)
MEHYFSLLLFTFTGQAAIGMILIRPLTNHLTADTSHGKLTFTTDHLVSGLLVFALATAFFHLGSPLRAVYALNNLTRSPLSMEIASLAVLMALSLATSWFAYKSLDNRLARSIPYVSIAGALILLLTMTSVYMLPSVPSWFNLNTPLAFVLTTISAGSALAAIMLCRNHGAVALRIMAIAVGSGVLLFTINAWSGGFFTLKMSGITIVYTISIVVAFVLILSLFLWTKMNKRYRMTVITGIVVLLSGIIARLMFFLSYDNNIL